MPALKVILHLLMRSIANLKQGESAVITSLSDKFLISKLIDMGCIPGEKVTLSKTAPLGCPLAIQISGYELSLRKEEAAGILVDLLP
jgi:ferrous iron transport protein A